MSSSTRRYADNEWLGRKASIQSMFLTENLSLDCIRERLGQDDFHITKHQLEHKLKKWGFRKKMPKNTGSVWWQYIGHQISKRTSDGKETHVIYGGRILDAQKVLRETNRYRMPIYGRAPGPEPPQSLRVTFRTPSPPPSTVSFMEAIPWLQFQTHHVRYLTLKISGRNSDTQVMKFNRDLSVRMILDAMNLGSESPLPFQTSHLACILRGTLPEQYPGEMDKRAEVMFTGTKKQVLQEHFMLLMFHLSNKSQYHESNWELILWILECSGIMSSPLTIADTQFTLRAAREALFELVFVIISKTISPWTRRRYNDPWLVSLESMLPKISRVVNWLLKSGQTPNKIIPGLKRQTPLQIASIYHMHDVQVALLQHRADPNLLPQDKVSGMDNDTPPLILAIQHAVAVDELKSVKLLFDYGANAGHIRYPRRQMTSQETIFTAAAGHSHADIAVYLMRYIIQHADDTTKVGFITADVSISAALAGNKDVLELLHEHKFDVTGANKFGVTPLHAAARGGHVECCELLLLFGSQVDHCHPFYPSPFHVACFHSNIDVVKLLHNAGAGVDCEFQMTRKIYHFFDYGPGGILDLSKPAALPRTPMGVALCSGGERDATVLYLLECGATLPTCATGFTIWPRTTETFLPTPQLLSGILRAGADPNARSTVWQGTPLNLLLHWPGFLYGKEKDRETTIQLAFTLLEAGADVSPGDAVGAMRHENWPLVEKILTKDSQDMSRVYKEYTGYELTLLEQAICTRNSTLIDNVLARHPNSYSPGALCAATLNAVLFVGDAALIPRLLKNRPTTYIAPGALEIETTAIGIAACFEHVAILGQLLAQLPIYNSARLPQCLSPGSSYWDTFWDSDSQSFNTRLYIQTGPLRDERFWKCNHFTGSVVNFALEGHTQILQRLLNHGYNFDYQSNDIIDRILYINPSLELMYDQWALSSRGKCSIDKLNFWIRKGDLDRLERLLTVCESPVHEKKAAGYLDSPLSNAIMTGQLDVVEMLLQAGFDPYAPAAKHKGMTALQVAASENRLGIAHRLLKANVDVNAPGADYKGRTALEAAAEHGHIDMVAFLLSSGAKTSGSGQKQYIRSIVFAEREDHLITAEFLRAHRPWSQEDENMMREDGILFENPGPIDTDSEYDSSEAWSTEDDFYSLDECVNTQSGAPVADSTGDYKSDYNASSPDFIVIPSDEPSPIMTHDYLLCEYERQRNSKNSDASSWYTTEDEDSLSLEEVESGETQTEISYNGINNHIILNITGSASGKGQQVVLDMAEDTHMAGYEADYEDVRHVRDPPLLEPGDIDMIDPSDTFRPISQSFFALEMDLDPRLLEQPSTGLFDLERLWSTF